METDCEKVTSEGKVSREMLDLTQILTTLSHQITNQNQAIQDHILQNDEKFQKVLQDNDIFKRDIQSEIDSIRNLIASQSTFTTTTGSSVMGHPQANVISNSSGNSAVRADNSSSSAQISSLPVVSSSSSTVDFQSQMMLMLTESFAKLSSALSDKKDETKSEWPKFSGDSKKFRSWYLAIMAQISLPPWQSLYDPATNDIVKTTPETGLNGKLYAKLLIALEGIALQNVVSRTHLRANGILLLQDLVQTYKPKHVPEVIAAKTSLFWGNTKRLPTETVDEYYNRFQELLDELSEADEKISVKSAMRHFLFTLGTEFEPIQHSFRIGSLPSTWHTQDWPTLLVLCRDYFHSVRPQGITKQTIPLDQNLDRVAQRKKVKEWFMNPDKFSKEIEAEQRKHPGKCIYHLSKTHPTTQCDVKKECDKILLAKKTSGGNQRNSQTSQGQLRHITEEFVQEEDHEECEEVSSEEIPNDTNEEVLNYFTCVTKHYLRLVKSTPDLITRHSMRFPIIADSGANFHMFREKEFFTSIIPATGNVILGDGQTTLKIVGIGTIQLKIGDQVIEIQDVRYVPDLSESIYSLFLHVRTPHHGLHSSFETGLSINFPNFQTKAIIGSDDIYLDAVPANFDSSINHSSSTCGLSFESPTLKHITHVSDPVTIESKKENNLLVNLGQYYDEVKTKRQLNLETPAGFRQRTTLQRQNRDYNLSNESSPSLDLPNEASIMSQVNSVQSLSNVPMDNEPTSLTNESSDVLVPILRCIDKPSSSLPNQVTYTEDFLRASVGFRRIDTMKTHLSSLYKNTIVLDTLPPDARLDDGDFANLRKSPRNTTPIPRPSKFGEVMHMDIVFGPDISLGNIHYGLLITDRFSRMTYLYPLQNLTTDICKQLEYFFAHIGMLPKRLITDFDTKLIGGKAREYLNSLRIHVNAAPSNRQDRNGLAERHWQTITAMARSWLASAELPAKFWYYAVKRAAEVCNYFPYKLEDSTWSTPLELAHNIKPDLRVLFKMFGLAAVRRERIGDSKLGKFEKQTIPMIAVGRCSNSNGLLFYNPENGTFVSSVDYKFQLHTTSGAHFNYKYQAGTFLYRIDETNSIFAPTFKVDSQVHVHTHSPPSLATVISIPTYQHPDVYTVVFRDGSVSEYTADLLSAAPEGSSPSPTLLPKWIQAGVNATLFLEDMSKPKHGTLNMISNEWYFYPGKSKQGILLPNFPANCQHLLDSGQLFRGHSKFKNVYDVRNKISLHDSVLRHISAHGLKSLIPPTSLKADNTLDPGDKEIWTAAYDEEYDGLEALPTWEIITEEQYRQLSKGKRALPTMAIATIKYDENNRPKRAKYRLVVLGNHDPHTWSNDEITAPVMSQLELRLLTSIAVYHKRVLKNCDVKQAFIQSQLPDSEEYFLRPPPSCPRSKPGQYWRLLRSLYGLKRAPRLWYTMLSNHLKSMGLRQSEHSPCIFTGVLVPGEAPIFVGIYVDDIIYFSGSDVTEKKFEELLSTIGSVDFMGQVSLFLGTEFTWIHHGDGNLSVSLTQQSFIETLLESLHISSTTMSTFTTPYRSGQSIDYGGFPSRPTSK